LALAVDLGAASNWAVLGLGAGNVSMSTESIAGNVGVAGGTFSGSGLVINGSLNLAAGVTYSLNSASSVTGGVQTGSLLAPAAAAATAASAAANTLAQTSSLSSILMSGGGMTLAPGVYDLSRLTLSGATLTLSGSGDYTFNIGSGGMQLSGASNILVANGANTGNVVFNTTGAVAISGNSVLDGTILAPNASVSMSSSLVDGRIISGKNISVSSGQIRGAPGPIVGAGLPAFALLGGAYLLTRRLRRRTAGAEPTALAST
jgi:choice-of-anchor A domain-containing protein